MLVSEHAFVAPFSRKLSVCFQPKLDVVGIHHCNRPTAIRTSSDGGKQSANTGFCMRSVRVVTPRPLRDLLYLAVDRDRPGQHAVRRERDLDLLVQFVPCCLLASEGRIDTRLR